MEILIKLVGLCIPSLLKRKYDRGIAFFPKSFIFFKTIDFKSQNDIKLLTKRMKRLTGNCL